MYRYVYKITITEGDLTGYYYYGKHTTKKIDDNYHGSSSILKKLNYFEKYPNGYKKEIIKMCMTDEEQSQLENDLIRQHKREEKCLNCLNTSSSGGNIMSIEKRKEAIEKKKATWAAKSKEEKNIIREKISKLTAGDKNPMWQTNYRDFMTEEAAKARDQKWYNTMMSKSPEEKAEINKKKGKGGKSLKGRIVISNEICIKRIKPEELNYYLSLGYIKGFKANKSYTEKSTKNKRTAWNKGLKTGKPSHNSGTKYMNNGKEGLYVKKEDIQKYLDLGYKFGMMKK